MANIAVIHKDIENFPSLREAFMVNKEAIHKQKTLLGIYKKELVDQETKIEIAKELGLPLQSFHFHKTRLMNQIKDSEKCIIAYESGYLEVPDFGQGHELDEKRKGWDWKFRFNGKVPLRVLQAVKEAKEKGLFKKIVVFQRGGDPIITGKIGKLYFYITSYK